MNNDVVFQKLARGLLNAGFQTQAGDESQDGLAAERSEALATIRHVAEAVAPIHPHFDREVIQRHLDMVRDWAALAGFKFVLGQPAIVAAVAADRLTAEELIALARRFDKVIVEMLDVTAKLAVGLRGVKLGATGILLFVFLDPERASAFLERTRKRCKILHLFKKTWVLPWVVDVSNKTVSTHRGLPFFMSAVLKWDYLQKQLFQSP